MNASAIGGWLQYNAERVQEVEDAYSDFVRSARMGIVLPCSLILSIGFVALLPHGWSRDEVLAAGFSVYYLLTLTPLLWVSKRSLGIMWRGAVDWPKACLWASLSGIAAGIASQVLRMIPLVQPGHLMLKGVTPIGLDVLWALVVVVAGAAWIQTRFASSAIDNLSYRRPYLLASVTLAPLAMMFLSLASYTTLPIVIAAFYQRGTGRSLAAAFAAALSSIATVDLFWQTLGVPR